MGHHRQAAQRLGSGIPWDPKGWMAEGPEGCAGSQQGRNPGLGSPGVVGNGGTLVSQGFGFICWNMQKWEEQLLLVQTQRVAESKRRFWMRRIFV